MNCFVAFGSNLGNRLENLQKAADHVSLLSNKGYFRASPVYETRAMVLEGSPPDWQKPYLNAVAEINWSRTPEELLRELKRIEFTLGRDPSSPRWSPRSIDLDLLLCEKETAQHNELTLPHPEIANRAFVLNPMRDLNPQLKIPGYQKTVLDLSRSHPESSPWIMGILNITPDSFSDGGNTFHIRDIEARIAQLEYHGVHAIDIGAESTRPGAIPVNPVTERERLAPVLEYLESRWKNKKFKPKISIDTRHPETARYALDHGADIINDVGGLTHPDMLTLLRERNFTYVLMHSLSVPADPKRILPENIDPVLEIKAWLTTKLEQLNSAGIELDRIIFDPGIGFGKTQEQSLTLLKRIRDFYTIPVRVLVGHSRKSFLSPFFGDDVSQRDAATLALSLNLAQNGVDILRVHDIESHTTALKLNKEFKS